MIYLFVYLPLACFVSYCLVASFSMYALSIAAIAVATGIATFVAQRRALLATSVAACIILYVSTTFRGPGSWRFLESLLLGSTLFLYVDWCHDLVVLRIRRIPYAAMFRRIRASLSIVFIAIALSIAITVIAVNTFHYVPGSANIRAVIPAAAAFICGYSLYLYFRVR